MQPFHTPTLSVKDQHNNWFSAFNVASNSPLALAKETQDFVLFFVCLFVHFLDNSVNVLECFVIPGQILKCYVIEEYKSRMAEDDRHLLCVTPINHFQSNSLFWNTHRFTC